MIEKSNFPQKNIEVRGASINNLKNIDIDIPLHKFVAITGPSGAGKSSLAMGILYAEGSRRYLEELILADEFRKLKKLVLEKCVIFLQLLL